MTQIQWELLSPGQFEDMISVLLSHLNPDVRRIDGSGGDAGRDVEFTREGGPEILQLKSFTGRMTAGRRRQVASSLRKASRRHPVAWHLIVAIDPTPGEDAWFDELRSAYPFPLFWKGRTWLNGQMAERAFIPRYFLEGNDARVVELLTELAREQAAVTDIRVGMERLGALVGRINEIDPYYRFDISVREKTVEAVLIPRYAGAELDHPVTFNLQLAFPDNDEGRAAADQFRAAMDFGSPVTVEAQYIQAFEITGQPGLRDVFARGGSLKLGPPQPIDDWSLAIVLSAIDTNETPRAELPILLRERRAGRRGVVMSGSDPARSFFITMTVDVESHRVNLNFKFSSEASHLPHDLLPALGFMRAALPPNRIVVLIGAERVPLGDPIEAPNVQPIEDDYIRLVEQLATLQRVTGSFFTMPAGFSREDVDELEEAVALLDGKETTKTWTRSSFVLTISEPEQFLGALQPHAEAGAFVIDGEATAQIAGHIVPLGRMRTHLSEASVDNMEEIVAALRAAEDNTSTVDVEVRLVARGDKTLRTKRLIE